MAYKNCITVTLISQPRAESSKQMVCNT